jgi:small subunit ribosomal protein S5
MAELLADSQALESTTVGIYRTATVVKGGRRFSFAALVVVGDRHGSVGIGYGKAPGVPAAIEKAQKDAKKKLFKVSLKDGTLPHPVTGRFGASQVRLLPAAPGTGVIAGGTARAVLEMVGVHDCLTKAYGSTNQKNLCKAVIEGLTKLRTKEDIARMRGIEIEKSVVDELLEVGRRYMPAVSGAAKAEAPVNVVGKGREGQRRGGSRGRRREEPAAPVAEAAPVEAPSQDQSAS